MIYAVQIIVAFIAHYLGRHDGPAADQFSNHGSTEEQQELFHGTGWKARANVIILACMVLAGCSWTMLGIFAVVLIFIMWPVFNISINLVRKIPKRPWDYVSANSNNIDELLYKWFGNKAGKWLLAISIAVVVIGNLLLYLIYAKAYPNCFRLV